MARDERSIDAKRVAIYIRWSTDDQKDGTTLEVQLDGCRHYVLSQGWQVNEDLIFIDDGYSGGNLDRPALTRLRKLVKAGKVDCVVAFKVDRLSRSVIDTVNLVLEEWDGRTYLKSAREPIDTTTAMGKQFFYMLVSYAEWERSVIRERTVSGRLRRAQEGYKPSAVAPYGYRHAPDKTGALEIVPEEAEVVRRIFQLYNSGMGSKSVVNTLNGEGIAFRDKASWNERTILYLLSNRIYVGDMVYGKLTRNPRRGKEEGEAFWAKNEEPLVVENSPFIPPILRRDEFIMAQEYKKKRTTRTGNPSGRANASAYLLTGIAKCRCGYSLYSRTDSGRTGREYGYYSCLGKKVRGKSTCDAANIPQLSVDKEIETRLKKHFGNKVTQEAFLNRLLSNQAQQKTVVEAELAQVQAQMEGLQEQEKKVRRDYRSDLLTITEFRNMQQDLEEELRGLRQRQSALEETRARLEEQQTDYHLLLECFSRLSQWNGLELAEQKNLLRTFVERLVIYRDPTSGIVDLDLQWAIPKA